MKNFFEESDFLKSTIQKNVTIQRKPQVNTVWHWVLLILFGLLAYGTMTQQFLLIAIFIAIAAIVKGPLMLLWGAIYSFLIAFFPPLGIVLSILFFLINLGTIAKSWRISLTGAYFYLVPLIGGILRAVVKNEPTYAVLIFVALSIVGLHFLLNWLYKNNSLSRTLTWSIINVPYAVLIMLLPTRFRRFKSNRKLKF
ncbi:hypothetical protein UAW_00112 [Enterococcus haemoperoxidus ATCC BAA-382]|uniref:Uncharacterized protein n=1 Tax=Enterococcus haemoperoxidus ATCC BAA-382 TaxID=1158608 RepID=R2QXX8_9ENTE|nr:hypothetical protein [Enterococcus haemoperoxidus]EOI00246.1 hypothetical protein UAW_00112 [Enterococcus haemoperoxidus ATCC BAA-382]EOT59664.1 hypothetical protein I583_02299 [Enterococcus haemoperoxidus ATCC BAA-382]OJG53081.1 hypothetical protein RV06_GL000797 [Enterococcus haemoperoxidus]